MTDDSHILDVIRHQPMTGSEIGKGFAPDHIKDRAGWGRKWLTKARNNALVRAVGDAWTSATERPKQNVAKYLLAAWTDGDPSRSYKHPLAPRGTPPRPRFPRNF